MCVCPLRVIFSIGKERKGKERDGKERKGVNNEEFHRVGLIEFRNKDQDIRTLQEIQSPWERMG